MKGIFFTSVLMLFIHHFGISQSSIFIGTGGSVITTGTSSITLENAKLLNNGTFSSTGGTVLVTGTELTSNTTLEGTGSTTFNNLTINKISNGLQLNQNIIVTGNLSLVKGLIHTNGKNLKCGTTSGASSASYVVTD
ncbi:MAG: hypothetical protein IT265_16210 [Saprospiraceae bacterium]|nr:hypothetical protein [Saprospiraceae bacterium]